MRTVRRLLFDDVVVAVGFVALAFLSLFFFVDFVDALRKVGRPGYTLATAVGFCLLKVPGNLYELAPIAVLIGAIYALGRMAQSSEYTILRTSGLGPGRALRMLSQVGLAFAVVTFLVGDVIAPIAERQAAELQARQSGGFGLGRGGAWLKEKRTAAEGPHSVSVNVGGASSDGTLRLIRIFEFDASGRLLRRLAAEEAHVERDGAWRLVGVDETRWPAEAAADDEPVRAARLESIRWATTLQSGVVAAAVLPVDTMTTWDLAGYIGHLSRNDQAVLQHQLAFWKRAVYPFACLVMVALALPFAYLHARAGGISLKVFGGIMLGISFVLMNNVAGYLGLLRDWTPWLVAAAPSLVYLGLSMAAFWWLVRFR